MTKQQTKFKQTEIGMIPEEWEVEKIKELGKVITGKTPPTKEKEYFGSDYLFIKIPDMSNSVYINKTETMLSKKGAEYMNSLKIPKDSVVVSCLATIGKVGITTRDSFTNQQINSLICDKNKVIPLWVYYYFKLNTSYLESLGGGGSVYTNISKSKFENALIFLPPLPEQRAIAKILSDLDAKIELNQQMNKTLEAIGQAIFKHWFVDFEFPNEKGKPYKSSGGEMVYNEELGKEIPKRWKVKPIDEIADFLNGLPLQKFPPENENEFLPVIKIRELRQGITDTSDKASLNIPKEYIVNDGDVLFSWSGSLEVVIWTFGEGALNQHLFKVTSKDYPKWFYYYWIIHYLPEYRHIAEGKATTMGHIQRHHLKSSLVLVPDANTLERMNRILNPIIKKIIKINIEPRTLSAIRDSLLPKLMSGKIRVPVEAWA